ncbi:MAG: oxygenase MpaB family protein [Jatrophihabitantaceae bacterium]
MRGFGWQRRSRWQRLDQARALDPVTDQHRIARLLTEYEFPWDMVRSLELALFRTYAVPSIGALLHRTGEFERAAQKRYDDTVVLLYEIWLDDAGSEGGSAAAGRLNQIHHRYRIGNADYLYTLATFVVMPVRWNAEFGWRRMDPVEIAGWTNAMRSMGQAMGLTDIPLQYQQFSDLLDEYERAHFGYRPASRAVADATLRLLGSWYPRPLRPLARWTAVLLLDRELAAALRLPAGPAVARWLVRAGLRARALAIRLGPPRPASRPYRIRTRTYPTGYRLDELGPQLP